jgi:hypothetical protein
MSLTQDLYCMTWSRRNISSKSCKKLATASVLINTCPETPIKVTNSLHPCGDCHTATKLISKIVGQEIDLKWIPNNSSKLDKKENSSQSFTAFVLINTCPGTPIQETNRLHARDDCQSAIKLISRDCWTRN